MIIPVKARSVSRPRKLRLAWNGRFGPLPKPDRWVFIVGCYNSGTTLLHDMLAVHPRVGSMAIEGQFLTDELPLPRDFGLSRLWALAPERFRLGPQEGTGINVDRLKRQWGAQFDDPRRPILLEKSPTNAGRTRWLQEHFENAHFIGIVRDGYAVAEGIRRKAGHPLELAARQWRVSNEIMLEDFEHLENRLLVRYEDLVDKREMELERAASFLQLDIESFPLRDTWRIHGHDAALQNMNSAAVGKLSADEVAIVSREAGALLTQLGYAAGTT
jgi:hypothetical protein